jgi:hypothetical protein
MAVGAVVLLEVAFGVYPSGLSVVGITCWYVVQLLVKQKLKRRDLTEKMEMAQSALEGEDGSAAIVPDMPPGHLPRWVTPRSRWLTTLLAHRHQ